MGAGINLAARIEGVAAAGGISLSHAAYEQVRDRPDIAFTDRGEVLLKNIVRQGMTTSASSGQLRNVIE
jgi:class 3 adenylate cyclase